MKAAVCLYHRRSDGMILGVSRKNDPTKFGLPGGKVDPEEEPHQAIVREVFEETGLVVSDPRPVFIRVCEGGKDGIGYVTTTYIGNITGHIHTNETGVVKWVTQEELLSGPFGTYNAALFHAIEKTS